MIILQVVKLPAYKRKTLVLLGMIYIIYDNII